MDQTLNFQLTIHASQRANQYTLGAARKSYYYSYYAQLVMMIVWSSTRYEGDQHLQYVLNILVRYCVGERNVVHEGQ